MDENGCEGSYGAPSVPASPAAPSRDAAEGTTNPKTLSGSPTKGALATDTQERAEGAGEAAGPPVKAPGSAEGGEGGTEGGEEGTEGDGAPAKPVATLYVGNLPPEADEHNLMAIFYHFGPIINIQACACVCHLFLRSGVQGVGTQAAPRTPPMSQPATQPYEAAVESMMQLESPLDCLALLCSAAAGSNRVPMGSGLREAGR